MSVLRGNEKQRYVNIFAWVLKTVKKPDTWNMSNQQILRRKLLDLDNNNYKAYRDIQGTYEFPDFTLIIDYVQGDPFAAPSKLRVLVPHFIANLPS